MPISGAGVGMGGRAHAANEFYVIEGTGKVYGMAGAEKMNATVADGPLSHHPSVLCPVWD